MTYLCSNPRNAMNAVNIKFNRKDQPEFLRELRAKVNEYFDSNNLSIHANLNMKIKTVFMVLVYFTPLVAMLFGWVTGFWPTMVMWVVMGFGMAGIGTSVMHDALHGAYSKNKNVNQVLGFMIQFIGGTRINWKIQHNVLHHAFTNIAEYDEDIDVGIMRFSPNQKWKWFYRFQAYYAVVLYALMTLHWALTKDFIQLKRYERKNLLSRHGVKFKSELAKLITHKAWYFVLILVLPLIFIDLPWWQVVLGFVAMQLVCGLTLALAASEEARAIGIGFAPSSMSAPLWRLCRGSRGHGYRSRSWPPCSQPLATAGTHHRTTPAVASSGRWFPTVSGWAWGSAGGRWTVS